MATKDDLTSIAEYVWRYISPKIEERLSHNIQWYRAKVTKAAQDGRISVQRPFDSTVQSLPYVASMATANVGDEVTVFTFGGASGGNNDNSVIVNNGSYSYFSDDFVIEEATGTGGIWHYRKWYSGLAECWEIFTTRYANPNVLQRRISLPFSFASVSCVLATINDNGGNSASALSWNCKATTSNNSSATISVHSTSGVFTSDSTIDVSLKVIGTWK